MNQFSIRDIENLCGVKAHTLRIWEQRYNLFIPKRKESQHRVYDCEDLKILLRICYLYHNGYKISKIAELNLEQIQEEVEKIKPSCCNYELHVHQLVENSITLNKEGFEKVVNGLVLRIGLEKCIIHVFYPFLERIGMLWLTNHIVPAQEHFSSHLIRKKIICAIDGMEPVKDLRFRVVIFSPPGEHHEIPLLVIQYFLRKQGIQTIYFGINTAVETIEFYAEHHPVTHLYMHVITHLDNCGLDKVMNDVATKLPGKTLIVSGPACCSCVSKHKPNIVQLSSMEELLALGETTFGTQ